MEELDEFELGILVTSVVFEPRKNQDSPILSKSARRIKKISDDTRAKQIQDGLYKTEKIRHQLEKDTQRINTSKIQNSG